MAKHWTIGLVLLVVASGCGGDNDTADPTVERTVVSCDAVAPACDATDLEGRMACVPDLVVTRNTERDFNLGDVEMRHFGLALRQPIDHHDWSQGMYWQQATLYVAHVDGVAQTGRPMVLYTSGYLLFGNFSELVFAYGTHQLEVEHRFFGESVPEPRDWQYLTIEQQVLDEHRWIQSLKWIFDGNWVNTGASKGGVTAVLHRQQIECDFVGTLANVAPFSQLGDGRYDAFLQDVGGDAYATCRRDFLAFQRMALTRRDAIVPLMSGSFEHLGGADVAFEHVVIETPWAFWQYLDPDDADLGCARIPNEKASDQDILDYLDAVVDIGEWVSDESLDIYGAYYYQAAAQLGDYLPPETGLADLLRYPGTDRAATYAPRESNPVYDGRTMDAVLNWVANEASDVIFIYGEFDPWTAGAIADPTRDAVIKETLPGGNHGAIYFYLESPAIERVSAKVTEWMGQAPRFKPRSPGTEARPVLELPPGFGHSRRRGGIVDERRQGAMSVAGAE